MTPYRPEPRAQLEQVQWPVILDNYLGWSFELHVRISIYRSQVRDGLCRFLQVTAIL